MSEIRTPHIVALYSAVKDFFAAQSWNASIAFGRKARDLIINQGPGGANRVVFIPGALDPNQTAPSSVDAGEFTEPRGPGGTNPRRLYWWHQPATLSIWAVDTSDLTDDAKQHAALVTLIEQTMIAIRRAVYTDVNGNKLNVGLADVRPQNAQYRAPPVNLRFGDEFFCHLDLNGPILDLTIDTTTPQPAINRDPAS